MNNQFNVTVLFAFLLFAGCFSQSDFEFPNTKVEKSHIELMEYWTEERMAKAIPHKMPVINQLEKLSNKKSNASILATNIVSAAYSTSPYKIAGRLFFSTARGGESCT